MSTKDIYRDAEGRRVIVQALETGTGAYTVALYRKGERAPYATDAQANRHKARAVAAELLGLEPVYLQRGRMEVGRPRNGRPGYAWVNAWRLVSARDCDAVQPWSRTKTEARETAAKLGYLILGELD